MDFYDILLAKKLGGGGSSITVEELNVTDNGTYTADEGKAYSPVNVNVSGGGGFTPTLDVTIVNNTAQTIYTFIDSGIGSHLYFVVDNTLLQDYWYETEPNETKEYKLFVGGLYNYDSQSAYFILNYHTLIDVAGDAPNQTISSMVNCTDNDGYVTITDPSKNASFTITATDA